MSSYNATGIVIGRTNIGEADRIVRFLTPEHGKLSAVAKGVRKIKSRSAGHLELFGEVNLMLTTGRSLDIITSARLSWYPHALAADYTKLGLAYAAATMVDRLTQEREAQPELYAHLAEMLRAIDEGAVGALIELWFKLRLLQLTGFRPELEHCLVCGQHDADTAYAFDAPRGGIVCLGCGGAMARAMSRDIIKLWRLLCDYPYATVSHIGGGEALAADSVSLCDEFYEHHIGRAFRPGVT